MVRVVGIDHLVIVNGINPSQTGIANPQNPPISYAVLARL